MVLHRELDLLLSPTFADPTRGYLFFISKKKILTIIIFQSCLLLELVFKFNSNFRIWNLRSQIYHPCSSCFWNYCSNFIWKMTRRWCQIQWNVNWKEDRVPWELDWKGVCIYSIYYNHTYYITYAHSVMEGKKTFCSCFSVPSFNFMIHLFLLSLSAVKLIRFGVSLLFAMEISWMHWRNSLMLSFFFFGPGAKHLSAVMDLQKFITFICLVITIWNWWQQWGNVVFICSNVVFTNWSLRGSQFI